MRKMTRVEQTMIFIDLQLFLEKAFRFCFFIDEPKMKVYLEYHEDLFFIEDCFIMSNIAASRNRSTHIASLSNPKYKEKVLSYIEEFYNEPK